MGFLGTAAAIWNGTGVKDAPKAPPGPSFYQFWALDEADKKAFECQLRLAPSSLHATTPMRGQVSMDFDGRVSLLNAGPGVSRWTLGGEHGVGKLDAGTLDKTGGDSPGLAAMKALQDFFVRWAQENVKRQAAGKAELRLCFAIVGGGPSELRYARWIIWPETFPTWDRTTAKPLGWDWSLTFRVLESLDQIKPEKARASDPAKRLGALDKLMAKVGLKPWDPRKGLLANLKEQAGNASRVRTALKDGLGKARQSIGEWTGLARSLAANTRGILYDTRKEVRDTRTMVKTDVAVIRESAVSSRRLAGAIRREALQGRLR